MEDGSITQEHAQGITPNEELIFQCAEEIQYLAHHARLQAYEAEIRADCAISSADRAVEESQAVQAIAESLTKTARIIAKISLDEKIDPKGIFSTIINHDGSKEIPPGCVALNGMKIKLRTKSQLLQSSREHAAWCAEASRRTENQNEHLDLDLDNDDDESSDKTSPLTGSHNGGVISDTSVLNGGNLKRAANISSGRSSVDETDSMYSSRSIESVESLKYDDPSPDDVNTLESKAELIRSLDSAETLPTVYEDSYQGPRENRSIPWSEKKSLRKLQRKLKDLEVSDEDDSVDEGQGSLDKIIQGEMSMEEESLA